MSLLPWLLRWPPRRATVALFLAVTVFSLGTLALFGGVTDATTEENVTVETTDLSVRLNDEQSLPEGDGGVQTCIASGTPPDRISVLGSVRVAVPADHPVRSADELRVVVALPAVDETTSGTVEPTGGTFDVFWLLDDDESLSVGDTATVQVRVLADADRVADATREVTVESDSRTYDC